MIRLYCKINCGLAPICLLGRKSMLAVESEHGFCWCFCALKVKLYNHPKVLENHTRPHHLKKLDFCSSFRASPEALLCVP